MKRTIRLILILALTVCTVCSCDIPFFGSGGRSLKNYTAIYADGTENELETQYVTLFLGNAVKNAHGTEMNKKSDKSQKADGVCEIIIGDTSRPLSAEAKSALSDSVPSDVYAFSIVIKDGDVAIYAKDLNSIKLAASYFVKNYLSSTPTELSEVMFTTYGDYIKNGIDAQCRPIAELDAVATLDKVSFDGETFDAFDPSVLEYNVDLSVRDKFPTVTATCPSFVTASIAQSSDDVPFAIVTVTSKDGKNKNEYTFNFNRKELENVEGAKIEKVYGGRDAIVVIVHDDGTEATARYMAGQFKLHGLVGTIGLIGNKIADRQSNGTWKLNQSKVASWQSILDTGVFDIANHSLTHSFFGLTNEEESGWRLDSSGNLLQYSLPAGKITEEVTFAQQLLREAFPDQDVLAFIKPGFGRVSDENGTTGMTQISDKAYDIIASTHIGMRDTGGGNFMNDIPVENILKISSYVVRPSQTAGDWKSHVLKAINQNAMVVFLFHKIEAEPAKDSLNGTEAETDVFFEWLGQKTGNGDVWNTYLEDAIMYVEEYKNAKLDVVDYGHKIDVTVTDTLINSLYNHPLTVTVPIHEDVTSVTAQYADGGEEKVEIIKLGGNSYVRIDIVPDSGTVSLITE